MYDYGWLRDSDDWAVLDVETTGLGGRDEIIELAIVGSKGDVLYNELILPTVPISKRAFDIHGIHVGFLHWSNATSFVEHLHRIENILGHGCGVTHVFTWGRDFDERLFRQTYKAHRIECPTRHSDGRKSDGRSWGFGGVFINDPEKGIREGDLGWHCVMRWYMEFMNRSRWDSLKVACVEQGVKSEVHHRALADAMSTYHLITKLINA